jgi:hypothetical protein
MNISLSRFAMTLLTAGLLCQLQACTWLTRPALTQFEVQTDILINQKVVAHQVQVLHPYFLVSNEQLSDIPLKHPVKTSEKNNSVFLESYYQNQHYWLDVYMNIHHVQNILPSTYQYQHLNVDNTQLDLLGGDYGIEQKEASPPALSDIYMGKLLDISANKQMKSVFKQSFTIQDDTHPEEHYQEDIQITITAQ